MDLIVLGSGHLPTWFPRPRGDGPVTHANGLAGFPAHVDPPGVSSWFPRPRGDGPTVEADSRTLAVLVSPPTRGWTLISSRYEALTAGGFPAHAGMDHRHQERRSARRETRVSPPTRGWTVRARTLPSACVVSPPTRGWTHDEHPDAGAGAGGFPAHAGMDPQAPLTICAVPVSPPTRGWTVTKVGVIGRRFPRPRGDGPYI